jgi:hypothetical protein
MDINKTNLPVLTDVAVANILVIKASPLATRRCLGSANETPNCFRAFSSGRLGSVLSSRMRGDRLAQDDLTLVAHICRRALWPLHAITTMMHRQW